MHRLFNNILMSAAVVAAATISGCFGGHPQGLGSDSDPSTGGDGDGDGAWETANTGNGTGAVGSTTPGQPSIEPDSRCGEVCPAGILGEGCCTTALDVSEGNAVRQDMCGLDLSAVARQGCVESNQPGALDLNCPAIEEMGMSFPGCCTSRGVCGSMIDILGLGCTSAINTVTIACGGARDAGA